MGLPELRSALRADCRRAESECVGRLLAEFDSMAGDCDAARQMARQLVSGERQHFAARAGFNHLLHEFALSSQEGVALMCLAEALLRIPDSATVDRLIRDKIGRGDWQSHLAGDHPMFVNAATWGLMLTGKLVAIHHHGDLGNALTRLLARGGEPLIRKSIDFAMRLLGEHFVMGETIVSALARSRTNEARGYRHSFDMLGEAALTAADAERYCRAYETAIHAIGTASAGRGVVDGPGISIKLSALHPRYVRSQRGRVLAELGPRLQGLMRLARDYDIGVNIDAEEADRLDLSLDIFAGLAGDPELAGWDGLGFVVQAYQKRSPAVIDWLVEVARQNRRRIMVRLVKGAYWDSEIKRAQVDGLSDYPVFTRKAHTDLAYLVCAGRLLAAPDAVYPQFATHNALTLATVLKMAEVRGVADYEFQCLHGMGEPLYDQVVGSAGLGKPCRIYAPVGTHRTLLPYLVRRLLENGANSSFVNRIVDAGVSIDELLEDPAASVRRDGCTRHPKIPLPPELYGPERRNSAGSDLADEATLAGLADELQGLAGKVWRAGPMLAGPGPASPAGSALKPVFSPANAQDQVGSVIEATSTQVESALVAAAGFSEAWFQTPPAARAAILQRAADLLQAQRAQLVSLLIREAGKTWPTALAEVREAVDFCRYYGQPEFLANFEMISEAPGPVACISPWNFPLAIFIGQVSAALAVGSPVLAKPAAQTPLIAGLAVELLQRAGVPGAALQLLPGSGEIVGAALTADARVRGVVFTGSAEVARRINRSIAGRDEVRLIAETGGQNAMIVDSSALPEQVVQDVLASGFDSAGQRCSALRVLCLQDEIADTVLHLLKAAMGELRIGDPADLATDIGPVIDRTAQSALLAHIADMAARGRAVFQPPLPADCVAGSYVPPTLIGIESLADLAGEVFGPVVHVLRYKAGQLDTLIDAINATGYGLTLGIHSRIDETIQRIVRRARVGNIYVNRNMVGAVVGVQPFGGEGLSGTGPKAGGPLYLARLAGAGELRPGAIGARRESGAQPPSDLVRLSEWARFSGYDELAALCADYAELTLLNTVIDLPGPTGEQNTLRFAPRGTLLCLAAEQNALLHQLAAIWATGNRAAAVDGPETRKTIGSLPDDLAAAIEWRPPDDYHGLAGVLSEPEAPPWQHLAREPGPLLATYQPADNGGHYPLYRMLVERVLTVNTTAAGGNTTLMMLDA
ncbi:bifunctional proline dehydrogenase/L-glutamate gamma-semialdehyde dehydrogenase PutA [Ferribacterium limneticum]|uniref:bifunctional proline dehydrogenase/L-glutamate gamma-semialdehyde dehydrogenase PutA n=1 Tax=Ferribacterium limneticum TaxID=76259 RepID=UPI001CF8CD88|nr:bifunctional proline dehydrogenase/L-glutamate gamma-semialdehyde dehydrogenase PutA [Ferribacterium limneticum]